MDMEKVIEAFDDAKELVWLDDDEYTVGYNDGIEAGKNITLAMLKEQDAVVHCKDCKNNNQCSIQFKFADADNPDNWFCAYGKRKNITQEE